MKVSLIVVAAWSLASVAAAQEWVYSGVNGQHFHFYDQTSILGNEGRVVVWELIGSTSTDVYDGGRYDFLHVQTQYDCQSLRHRYVSPVTAYRSSSPRPSRVHQTEGQWEPYLPGSTHGQTAVSVCGVDDEEFVDADQLHDVYRYGVRQVTNGVRPL